MKPLEPTPSSSSKGPLTIVSAFHRALVERLVLMASMVQGDQRESEEHQEMMVTLERK